MAILHGRCASASGPFPLDKTADCALLPAPISCGLKAEAPHVLQEIRKGMFLGPFAFLVLVVIAFTAILCIGIAVDRRRKPSHDKLGGAGSPGRLDGAMPILLRDGNRFLEHDRLITIGNVRVKETGNALRIDDLGSSNIERIEVVKEGAEGLDSGEGASRGVIKIYAKLDKDQGP